MKNGPVDPENLPDKVNALHQMLLAEGAYKDPADSADVRLDLSVIAHDEFLKQQRERNALLELLVTEGHQGTERLAEGLSELAAELRELVDQYRHQGESLTDAFEEAGKARTELASSLEGLSEDLRAISESIEEQAVYTRGAVRAVSEQIAKVVMLLLPVALCSVVFIYRFWPDEWRL